MADPRTRTIATQKRGHGQEQGNANAQRQQTRAGLQHRGPRRAEPTEQGQSSGAEGPARATRREADDENNPRILNANGVDEPPVYNTVHACATHGEASVHIGILTTSNAHPDCPEAIVDTTRQDEVKLQHLGRLQGEGCRCLANHPERAPYLYPARDGGNTTMARKTKKKNSEPRIYTPPGTAASQQVEPRIFVPRPGRRPHDQAQERLTKRRRAACSASITRSSSSSRSASFLQS